MPILKRMNMPINWKDLMRIGSELETGDTAVTPICLAAHQRRPVVILPGFPTSAIFTFHEFVAPVIRELAGLPPTEQQSVSARLAQRIMT